MGDLVKRLWELPAPHFLANVVVDHHLERLIETFDDEDVVACAKLLLTSMYVDDVPGAVEKVQ